jgi:hypothetical protein
MPQHSPYYPSVREMFMPRKKKAKQRRNPGTQASKKGHAALVVPRTEHSTSPERRETQAVRPSALPRRVTRPAMRDLRSELTALPAPPNWLGPLILSRQAPILGFDIRNPDAGGGPETRYSFLSIAGKERYVLVWESPSKLCLRSPAHGFRKWARTELHIILDAAQKGTPTTSARPRPAAPRLKSAATPKPERKTQRRNTAKASGEIRLVNSDPGNRPRQSMCGCGACAIGGTDVCYSCA